MKILLLLFLLFTPLLQAQHSSDLEGRWAGTIEVEGEPLNIELLFGFDDGILDGTIDIPNKMHLIYLSMYQKQLVTLLFFSSRQEQAKLYFMAVSTKQPIR